MYPWYPTSTAATTINSNDNRFHPAHTIRATELKTVNTCSVHREVHPPATPKKNPRKLGIRWGRIPWGLSAVSSTIPLLVAARYFGYVSQGAGDVTASETATTAAQASPNPATSFHLLAINSITIRGITI